MSIIYCFLDGIGLAPQGPDNPFTVATMPQLAALLGGPLTLEALQATPRLLLKPIDATLGVDGLPQSGTGHTALLGGFNAALAHGRHQPHFPPVALRPRLAADSLFHWVQAVGKQAAFANVFGSNYWKALESGKLRRAASAIAAEGAGVRLRTLEDYLAGMAVAWDITAEQLQSREPELPLVSAEQAGQVLARMAQLYDLVYFECYLPDLAAHERLSISLEAALLRIDRLIAAILAMMRPHDTLVITSDHGNAESHAAVSHTRNPVPLLAIGADAGEFAAVHDITEVARSMVNVLSLAHDPNQ
jgi:2,3-bisphosphoglycerate-independent phosphoglycerate mutase